MPRGKPNDGTENRGKGHPRIFKDEHEFRSEFERYIQHCRENKRFPNIAGFCAFKWITRESFYQCQNYYPDTYNRVRDLLEDEVFQHNTYMSQLYIKNTFGYRDKQEVTNTNVNVSGGELTEEEAKKYLKEHGIEV